MAIIEMRPTILVIISHNWSICGNYWFEWIYQLFEISTNFSNKLTTLGKVFFGFIFLVEYYIIFKFLLNTNHKMNLPIRHNTITFFFSVKQEKLPIPFHDNMRL